MRYVALKTLRCAGPDGVLTQVLAGQEVPNFASWSAAVRAAHLRIGNVRDNEKPAPVFEHGRVVMRAYGLVGPHAEPEERVPALAGRVKCHLCDHPGFTNQNSFRKHFTRKHASE